MCNTSKQNYAKNYIYLVGAMMTLRTAPCMCIHE
jgi:hypothetical protein